MTNKFASPFVTFVMLASITGYVFIINFLIPAYDSLMK